MTPSSGGRGKSIRCTKLQRQTHPEMQKEGEIKNPFVLRKNLQKGVSAKLTYKGSHKRLKVDAEKATQREN